MTLANSPHLVPLRSSGSEMLHIDDEKRREWLRALRRFKDGIKVRAKLGVLQTICEQVAAERKGKPKWDAPRWEHELWVTFLYTCIKNNEFPSKLLRGFVKTAEVTFFNQHIQPTVEGTVDAVDIICRQQSKRLREKFGVFIGTHPCHIQAGPLGQ